MAKKITSRKQLMPGDLFENCSYQPCLCITISGDDVTAISLVDGSPLSCSIRHCGLRRLTIKEAWIWKIKGPQNLHKEQVEQVNSIENKWWNKRR